MLSDVGAWENLAFSFIVLLAGLKSIGTNEDLSSAFDQ